jgi:SOS-response transcriptional repressor LexA
LGQSRAFFFRSLFIFPLGTEKVCAISYPPLCVHNPRHNNLVYASTRHLDIAHAVFADGDLSDLEYAINRQGMEKLAEYKKLLIASGLYAPVKLEERVIPFRRRTAPMYDIGASAGTGQFLDSDSYEMVEVPENVPDSATFGLHICGDSMEPTLEDGQAVWVQMQPSLENGEVGIFYLDGNAYVKEYRQTEKGVFLVSHNEKYAPIAIKEYNETRIYGKVVYPRC